MTHPLPRWLAYGCLALSMALVGSYVALSKPLVAAFPVFLLAWLRFGIGGAAMLHWLKKPATEAPMTPQIRRLVFLESFLGNFLFSICMLFGVSMTSAVSAGVIMASIPAVVALMSWVFLRERIAPRVWGAVACAALGIGLLALSKSEHPMPHGPGLEGDSTPYPAWLGNLLVLGAVLCEAAYAVIGKKLTGALGPRRITALINLWGFALVTPLGIWAALSFDFGGRRAGHVAAAGVLRAGGQRLDGLAVDDRPSQRAGLARRRVHRDAADLGRARWRGRAGRDALAGVRCWRSPLRWRACCWPPCLPTCGTGTVQAREAVQPTATCSSTSEPHDRPNPRRPASRGRKDSRITQASAFGIERKTECRRRLGSATSGIG